MSLYLNFHRTYLNISKAMSVFFKTKNIFQVIFDLMSCSRETSIVTWPTFLEIFSIYEARGTDI